MQLLEEEGRKMGRNKEERRRTRKFVALPTVVTGGVGGSDLSTFPESPCFLHLIFVN